MTIDQKFREHKRHKSLRNIEKSLERYTPASIIVHLQVDTYLRKYGSDIDLNNLIDKYEYKLRSQTE